MADLESNSVSRIVSYNGPLTVARVNGDDLGREAYHQEVGFQRLVILMIFRYTLNTADSSEDIKTFLKNRYFEEPWEALETQILKATKHLFRRSWDPRVYDAIATMPDSKVDFVSHYEGCDACGRRLANANTYRDVVISGRVYDRRTLVSADAVAKRAEKTAGSWREKRTKCHSRYTTSVK